MAAEAKRGVFDRLDALYEFDRQPVTADKLQPGGYFAGAMAGEHIAATEFVIGALFVSLGATALDVLVGLLVGNLLAVLSWTLVCAPIAVQTRLTLYWYLRKIAGPPVTVLYNVLNALLFCVLAGAMITVSASAIRIPFGIKPQTKWLPEDPTYQGTVPVCPAPVRQTVCARIKELALASHSAVGAPPYARVDFRTDERGRLYVIEVNPNPDLSPNTGMSIQAEAAGMEYADLIQTILEMVNVEKHLDKRRAASYAI